MKKNQLLISNLLVLILILSACNKSVSVTPQAIPTTQTIAPATEIPSTPTLQTIALDTPTIGSTISWFDTSTLVYVPEGEFSMGADEPKEKDFNPSQVVALDEFWIYSTKVTREMYNLCIVAGQCVPPALNSTEPVSTFAGSSIFLVGSDPNEPGGKDFPITDVNWDQASAYCQWAGGRLPTEAEWEKTARGFESQVYPWGDAAPSCDLLNFDGCSGFLNGVLDHPAGMSEYKAFDMAGNAFEWVSDWYQADYYAQSPSVNPTGPEAGTARSVRGSSFESTADAIPSFVRHSLDPDQHKVDLGFRCVIPDPNIFAPMCSAPAQIPANSGSVPQAGQPASGSSNNSTIANVIDIKKIYPMQASSYCIDPKTKVGGAIMILDVGQFHNALYANCDFPITYTESWGGKVPETASVKGPVVEYGFSEPEGLPIDFITTVSCKPKQPASPPPKGVPATCAVGYTLQTNGICQYVGTAGQAGSVACPAGYSYNQQSGCCTVNPPQTGNPASQYPACGPGSLYDAQQQVCYKHSNVKVTSTTSSYKLTFYLGTCMDKKPKEKDKPQQPPPCTIDPATGACN